MRKQVHNGKNAQTTFCEHSAKYQPILGFPVKFALIDLLTTYALIKKIQTQRILINFMDA